MKILIVYGTSEGQTRKIARFMEDELQEVGHQVALSDASDEPPAPKGYDAVLIGASVHMHQYQAGVSHYIREHAEALAQLPTAFFSVCLAIASDDEESHAEVQKLTDEYLEKMGWEPRMQRQIAGALKYTRYDFFKRWIMKMISQKAGRETDTAQDHEFTDWVDVRAFVMDFAARAKS